MVTNVMSYTKMPGIFRYDDAWWPNLLAISYILAGYFCGLILMLLASLWLNVLGSLWFAHSMVISAYLIHECAHNSIFRKNSYHRWLAEILLWVCGVSYSHYDDVRHKHVRHHTDRADIVSFDYRQTITNYPKLLKLIQWLEWLYIPAMEIVMHGLVIVLPFVKHNRKHLRTRVFLVLILRLLFLGWLSSISARFLLFYVISYILFLIIMRFMDIHQHSYQLFDTLDSKRGKEARLFNREFEQKNTYSNLLSIDYPWVNLLVLNFPYHNVHHAQPGRPWYQLPALHGQLYGNDKTQVLSFWNLLKSYHKYRVERVLNADEINLPVKQLQANFIGVDGVSFLTTH